MAKPLRIPARRPPASPREAAAIAMRGAERMIECLPLANEYEPKRIAALATIIQAAGAAYLAHGYTDSAHRIQAMATRLLERVPARIVAEDALRSVGLAWTLETRDAQECPTGQ